MAIGRIGIFLVNSNGMRPVLKAKLEYWALVKTSEYCLELYDDIATGSEFGEHYSIEENETRLTELRSNLFELEEIEITADCDWNDMVIDHDMRDEDYTSDDHDELTIEVRRGMVSAKCWEYQDEIDTLESENVDLRCRLEYIEMDAMSAVKFLACKAEFTPLY